jgi:hypothetical protein
MSTKKKAPAEPHWVRVDLFVPGDVAAGLREVARLSMTDVATVAAVILAIEARSWKEVMPPSSKKSSKKKPGAK